MNTNVNVSSWQKAVDDFIAYSTRNGIISGSSISSYRVYLNKLNEFNNGQTLTWIKDSMSAPDPIRYLISLYDSCVPHNNGTYKNRKTALTSFGKFMIGHTSAQTNLTSINKFDDLACEMIAKTAIFCDPDVVKDVIEGKLGSKDNLGKGNSYASWFNCNCQRKAPGTKSGQILNGIYLDDNTRANKAIKCAVLEGLIRKYGIPKKATNLFKDYEACHIWDGTVYDAKYYTSLTNIVLVPRTIAGFTDHCAAVKELLKYESNERFKGLKGIVMPGIVPKKPTNYNKIVWR